MFRELSAPVSLQWEVTSWCNLNCVHCYNYWRQDTGNFTQAEFAPIRLYESVVSEILANNVFAVTVTGGEPLGVFGEVLPFLKQLTRTGVRLGLNSNLTLLTKKVAMIIRDELGIKSIVASLPSANPETNARITQRKNALADTTRGIKIALENGLEPLVNMVVTKLNLKEVFLTAEYAASLGVKSFSATRAAIPGNCPDFTPFALTLKEFRYMLDELVRVKEQLGMRINSLEFYPLCSFGDEKTREIFGSRMCTAGKTSCAIGFDGQVRPCAHAPQTYGNIDKGLVGAWQAMSPWRTDTWLPQECNVCSAKGRCVGGCKVEAFFSAGTMSAPDPYCNFAQLPIKDKKKRTAIEIAPTDTFVFNQNLRIRREEFGGILYVSSSQWISANHELYNLAQSRKRDTVGLSEIATALGVSESEVLGTVRFLISKSVLQENEGR